MPTTSYNPGDVLLIRMPVGEAAACHARPVMVARESKASDEKIFVVPITADPINDCNTIMIAMGSYEFARMGLVTAAYLNALPPIETPVSYVLHRIGKCPHRLLQQFLEVYSEPLFLLDNFPAEKYF